MEAGDIVALGTLAVVVIGSIFMIVLGATKGRGH